jgi:hypothetical protein
VSGDAPVIGEVASPGDGMDDDELRKVLEDMEGL